MIKFRQRTANNENETGHRQKRFSVEKLKDPEFIRKGLGEGDCEQV